MCFHVAARSGKNYYVWNPLIRESISPPILPSHYKLQSVGFGFCNTLKLYKVVLVMSRKKLRIFSFGVDTEWRKVVNEKLMAKLKDRYFGVYLNGKLHWIGTICGHNIDVICIFNMGSELVEESHKYVAWFCSGGFESSYKTNEQLQFTRNLYKYGSIFM